MSSPQDAPARKKQKARRAKKLAKWREKNGAKGGSSNPPKKTETAAKK